MRKSRKITLSVLVLVVGLIFLGCVFVVNASNRRSTIKYRPLTHYVKNNPCVFYWWFTYDYRLDLSNFLIGGFEPGEGNPPPKGTYDGYIEERELPDGRAEISVYLQLHDAPFWLWTSSGMQLIMEGRIDWYYEVERFIIDRPGAEIPNILEIPYEENFLLIAGSGTGYGVFTEFAADLGFTPGAEGEFYLFQYGEVYDWPYEILDVYQL